MTGHSRFAIAVAIILLGCGGHQGNGTLIGATCTSSTECGAAGVCTTSGKDGSCSLPCDVPGGVAQCPLGTYCDRENVQTDTAPKAEMTLCFLACTDNTACRSGYECKGVHGGPGKVCQSK
jgi:hypothetical protein